MKPKISLLIMILLILAAQPPGSPAAEQQEPGKEIIAAAVLETLASGMNGRKSSWTVDDLEITNQYTIIKNGETVYYYDIIGMFNNDTFKESNVPPQRSTAIVGVVKRGNKWYRYLE